MLLGAIELLILLLPLFVVFIQGDKAVKIFNKPCLKDLAKSALFIAAQCLLRITRLDTTRRD